MTQGRRLGSLALAGAVILGAGACTISRESPPPPPPSEAASDPATGSAPLRVVRHAYLARPVDQDWWETIHPAEAGDEFLLYLEPKVLGPAEGPWTCSIRSADGRVVARLPSLQVDPATARITFVVRTAAFPLGDYQIDLELEPNGLTHGPQSQSFRCRVEAP
jgi:hypothetical protein